MGEVSHSDQILALIDGVVGSPEVEDVQELLMPQFELVVAMSGMARVFEDQRKQFVDTHHPFWPRCEYTTPLEKRFRKQFVMPIHRAIHDEIHARLAPPPKPTPNTMRAFLDSVGE